VALNSCILRLKPSALKAVARCRGVVGLEVKQPREPERHIDRSRWAGTEQRSHHAQDRKRPARPAP
jgi:hypothetical protein